MSKIKIFDYKTTSFLNNTNTNNSSYQKQQSVETIDMLDLGKGPISVETYDTAITNINGITNIVTVDKLKEILNTGDKSNRFVVDLLCKELQEEIDKGNMEAYKFLEAIINAKKEHPGLAFDISSQENGSYYANIPKTVTIDTSSLNNHSTIFHEIGHALHHLNTGHEFPDDFENLKIKVRENIEDTKYWEFINYFSQQYQDAYNLALNKILQKSNMTYQEYLEYRARCHVEKYQKDSDYARRLAEHEIQSEIYEGIDEYMDESGVGALEDIMDAIFDGELQGYVQDSNEYQFPFWGHGEDYYDGFLSNVRSFIGFTSAGYDEIIANYTDLRVSGNTEALSSLKYMLGDELYNEIEKTYEKSIGL